MRSSHVQALEARTIPGALYLKSDGVLRCTACAHRCAMTEDRPGACGVRFRQAGELRVPFGYVARKYVRPVETNTIYHVRPGALALTFGMFGCDLRCPYCHNWKLSQALRDPDASGEPIDCTPDGIVEEAIAGGASVICAAYNEPMISAEWARAIFERAKTRGLVTALVSDGNTTPEALAFMRDVTDVYRIDLKAPDDRRYHALGGRMGPVTAAIAEAKRRGYWVEVVTLVVPGFNDRAEDIRTITDTILDVDRDIPLHLNAFQPRYRMLDRPPTNPAMLMSLAGIAYARGLSFVYVGNVPSTALSTTRCPECTRALVSRSDWRCTTNILYRGGCPCGRTIPGIW